MRRFVHNPVTITILQFMQMQITEPVKIFIDNKSAIEMYALLKITHKTIE